MKLTIEQTARLLKTSPSFLRMAIKKNQLNIGECAKVGKGKLRTHYVISPQKVAYLMGVSLEQLERMTHDKRRMRGETNEKV